ncbi:translation protein [Neoconidiobolus thromboides FSU 785]|nr:translation protein [Neoconidiobolus thromboides FSU 785]
MFRRALTLYKNNIINSLGATIKATIPKPNITSLRLSSSDSTQSLGQKYQVFRPEIEYERVEVNEIEQNEFDPKSSKRCGLIAKKKGMTCIWDESGNQIPCTVLQVEDCQVVFQKTEEVDGYLALQLGAVNREQHKVSKPLLGHFISKGVEPKHRLVEFKVSSDATLPVGTTLSAAHFLPGQFVDARAPSKGKGFQGGMKRHGFAGLRASHGVSLTHRSIGSTGQRAQPGKVFKGKKMPGRMGGNFVTVQNCKVIKIDTELNLIYLKGCIPGFNEQYVTLVDSVRKIGLQKYGLSKQQSYQPPQGFKPPFPTYNPALLKDTPRELVAKLNVKEVPITKS